MMLQALRVTQIPAFQGKQAEVFEVLCGLRPASPGTIRRMW